MPSINFVSADSLSVARRSGMTLVELIGGLAVGGVVLALAVRMVTGVSLAVDGLNETSLADTRAHNGMRWLAERLRSAAAPNDSQPFIGLSTSLSFEAYRAKQSGSALTEHAAISGSSLGVAARVGTDTLLLHTGIKRLEIDYLAGRGLDAKWQRTWASVAGLPTAIRLRLTLTGQGASRVDTVLLAVGLAL